MTDGVRGFYRGLSASYVGSMETALYFVMYEKMKLLASQTLDKDAHPTQCMFIAAVTKATASLICYPHGKLNESQSNICIMLCLYVLQRCAGLDYGKKFIHTEEDIIRFYKL